MAAALLGPCTYVNMEGEMARRPLLILPAPANTIDRQAGHGGTGKVHRPTRDKQSQRLAPRFAALEKAFSSNAARLQMDATGLLPEQVIVLETRESVADFVRAARNVPGMEWMGEMEEEDIPPDDDFFALDKRGQRRDEKLLRGRLFVVFSNQDALKQLLSLWRLWQSGEVLSRGLGEWKEIFGSLHDVRPWGVRDRIAATGIFDDWQVRAEHDQRALPCEIELWYRQEEATRQAAENRVVALVKKHHGRVVGQSVVVKEIAYHGLLVELPIATVKETIAAGGDIDLVRCESIQYLRACGQMAAVPDMGDRCDDVASAHAPVPASGDPLVALFDGFPLQNHQRLSGRLIVDDPDGYESQYQASERCHGTAMASLVLHGDLDATEPSLVRPLYVRPILVPKKHPWQSQFQEMVPENTSAVDLIHRSVVRLFEAAGGGTPAAPSVRVANLSIGIADRPFQGALSPLARLLDWLAWKYSLLFLVSAGNHGGPIELQVPRRQFSGLGGPEVQAAVLQSVSADTRNRRLLSPAEAVNVVTIGAVHSDRSGPVSHNLFDPYISQGLPSPINAQGMGFRRSIKPDLLCPGGRIALAEKMGTTHPLAILEVSRNTRAPGQKVAAPGGIAGEANRCVYARGTSNATAIATRTAALLHEVLQELRAEPGGDLIDQVPTAVWLKALLVHSADWSLAWPVLKATLKSPENSRQFREYLTRLVGYGASDPMDVVECTKHRVTALSGGILDADKAHLHHLPLPPSLSGKHGGRWLKVTLAWLSPVNPFHSRWQKAMLWFTPHNDPLGLERQQAANTATQRGTVQHEIFGGEDARAFMDGDSVSIQVNCRAVAGHLSDGIPYALALTLRVAEQLDVKVYDEVKARIHIKVPVRPSE